MKVVAAAISVAAALLLATPAGSAEKLKIGYITTFTGAGATIGKHVQDAVELALDHVGRKVGGLETEVIFADDQVKPDIGKQIADEMVKKHRVDFISGVLWSNVMMAVHKPITRSKTFLIGSNAGPSDIAGKGCSPYFFSTGLQNDQAPEALGKYMQDQKIDNVFVIVPNYQAGKDDVAGFKRYYKGKIVGEIYFPLGQQDFSAELSQIRNANPDAVFAFAPGGMGIQLIKQYAQAGLKGKIPFYSVYSSDETTLPAIGDAAVGNYETRNWNADLDNPANKRFVADFRKKYGYTPSWFGAEAYDSIMLIDSAVRATKGNLEDKNATMAALRKADFDSVRGKFTFNSNHFPIQDFYLLQAVKKGDEVVTEIKGTVFPDHRDAYYQQCKFD
jgi:branched-chain amino acid transport system substrate-binding protein